MRINANIMAINSHRQLGGLVAQQGKATEKLSSGFRINRAADDAAGLAISEKMRAQIRGMSQASRNAQDGISVVQTAEGALDEVHSILQRMKELAVQSANGSNQDDDRKLIQKEVDQLKSEIDAIAEKTQFNKMKLLAGNGTDPLSMTFQVGANKAGAAKAEEITIKISSIKVASLFELDDNVISLQTAEGAKNLMSSVEGAIIKLATSRADLGAVQNRLEHTIKNLDNAVENLTASESRIRHTDMAKEMMEFTRTNILNQAAQAMLAQANQLPQGVLQLLR
ncbi:flagellin [Clostridiales bacterium COT073_COT-073]|nr:flagellin [Clostridiales bacterium COT073_COT-073]